MRNPVTLMSMAPSPKYYIILNLRNFLLVNKLIHDFQGPMDKGPEK